MVVIAILSVAIPVVVAMLFFMPKEGSSTADVSFLPTLHAILNSITAFALVIGYYNIRKGNIKVHRAAMATAFGLSAIFLVSYVTYHFLGERTIYGGDGYLKLFYYFILLTHIVLAVVIVPLVLLSMYFALSNQFARHRRISKWTFPIWLYVAVTGVLVYIMISPYYS
ncbi:putative membrane protein [Pontibacter virosus]|uniref:Putative membrane protein n=1 Tax=Pontibacter virosus TaxID=1765052 RepID=A0A2U1AZ86_9BACT|nr:putative membrane protein [Pontibacter virosus]